MHSNSTSIDKEIKNIERRLKDYPNQEKRLIHALRLGEMMEDAVLDEINRTKVEREVDLKRLHELKRAKTRLADPANAEIKLQNVALNNPALKISALPSKF